MLGPWEEHFYPGSGDKAGLREWGEPVLRGRKGSGPTGQRGGWESCSRLLPPVWAGPGWMAKLVVASALAIRSGANHSPRAQMLPFSNGPVCGPVSEITSPYLFPHYQYSSSPWFLLSTPTHQPWSGPSLTAPPNNEGEGSGHSGFWIRTSFRPRKELHGDTPMSKTF